MAHCRSSGRLHSHKIRAPHMAAVFLAAAVLPSVQRAARRASTARLLAFTSDMKPQHLNSPNNPRLKLAKRLHARRQREKTGLILLEGQRLIADALDAGLSADFVLVSDEKLRDGALDRLLARVPAALGAPHVRRRCWRSEWCCCAVGFGPCLTSRTSTVTSKSYRSA